MLSMAIPKSARNDPKPKYLVGLLGTYLKWVIEKRAKFSSERFYLKKVYLKMESDSFAVGIVFRFKTFLINNINLYKIKPCYTIYNLRLCKNG